VSILTGIKLALIVGTLAFAYHLGGDSARTALEGFQAAQAANTAKAVLAERASGAAELARVNAIVKGYEDAALSPVTVGIGRRVLLAACPTSHPVPQTSPVTGGAVPARPVPASAAGLGEALDRYTAACQRDALRLNALQAAWPK
jgi:hypothetical protein